MRLGMGESHLSREGGEVMLCDSFVLFHFLHHSDGQCHGPRHIQR